MADALTPNFNFTLPEVGGSDDTWGGKLNTNWTAIDTLLKTKIDELTAKITATTEPGDIKARAVGVVPTGWLECDGSAVSRSAPYDKLFAVIGTTYGVGDNTSTFNLPDYRGEFLRGWDHGRGVDPARVINGVSQPDGMKTHTHGADSKTGFEDTTHVHNVSGNTSSDTHTHTTFADDSFQMVNAGTAVGVPKYKSGTPTGADSHVHTVNINSGGENVSHKHPIANTVANTIGADETRPRNQAIMYVIKF
jgi:microcystin-dependent protein